MLTKSNAVIAIAVFAASAACAKSEDATETGIHEFSGTELTIDCTPGFDQIKADAIAMDGMELISEEHEQIAYMTGPVSITITTEGHPAHPMLVRRDIVPAEEEGVTIAMAACGYGEKEAFDNAIARYDVLNQRYELQQKFTVKTGDGVKLQVRDPSEARRDNGEEDGEISITVEPTADEDETDG